MMGFLLFDLLLVLLREIRCVSSCFYHSASYQVLSLFFFFWNEHHPVPFLIPQEDMFGNSPFVTVIWLLNFIRNKIT